MDRTVSNVHKCLCCGGVYMDPQPDGSKYFHACPPVDNPAYQPDFTKPQYDPRETVKRAGHRDENLIEGLHCIDGKFVTVRTDPNDHAIKTATPVDVIQKSPGAGRVKVDV